MVERKWNQCEKKKELREIIFEKERKERKREEKKKRREKER